MFVSELEAMTLQDDFFCLVRSKSAIYTFDIQPYKRSRLAIIVTSFFRIIDKQYVSNKPDLRANNFRLVSVDLW